MDKYYYLASSLPLLKFLEIPFITRADFIAEAEKWLSSEDFIILSGAGINNFVPNPKDTSLLKEWKEFEYSLRKEISFYREARGKNADYKMRKDLSDILQGNSNPLEVERGLLLLRWNYLEEQEIEHFFDLDFLIVYYLKLQILERLASFNKEKGKERFEAYSLVE